MLLERFSSPRVVLVSCRHHYTPVGGGELGWTQEGQGAGRKTELWLLMGHKPTLSQAQGRGDAKMPKMQLFAGTSRSVFRARVQQVRCELLRTPQQKAARNGASAPSRSLRGRSTCVASTFLVEQLP